MTGCVEYDKRTGKVYGAFFVHALWNIFGE
jgi:hypothetical protein